HRVDDQLGRVVIPQDDVDALAAELARHRLHARTAHADAGADRIDAAVVRLHGDLGAGTRVAGGGADLDHLRGDLRHLDAAQLHQPLRAGAAQVELRAARFRVDLLQHATDAVADAEHFAADQLLARHHALGVAAQVDDDVVASDLLDDAVDQLADAVAV